MTQLMPTNNCSFPIDGRRIQFFIARPLQRQYCTIIQNSQSPIEKEWFLNVVFYHASRQYCKNQLHQQKSPLSVSFTARLTSLIF